VLPNKPAHACGQETRILPRLKFCSLHFGKQKRNVAVKTGIGAKLA
jgi:hypothetical protein